MNNMLFLASNATIATTAPADCPWRHSGQRGAFEFFRSEDEVVSEIEAGRYVGGDVDNEYVRWEMRSGRLVAISEDDGREIGHDAKTVRAYRIQQRFL